MDVHRRPQVQERVEERDQPAGAAGLGPDGAWLNSGAAQPGCRCFVEAAGSDARVYEPVKAS